MKYLAEALEQNTLFYWAGKKVKELNKRFAELYGVNHCVATSSGTAAIHTEQDLEDTINAFKKVSAWFKNKVE